MFEDVISRFSSLVFFFLYTIRRNLDILFNRLHNDFRGCLKAYHPECVGREESFAESEDRWICGKMLVRLRFLLLRVICVAWVNCGLL